jgi:hypothetical protein
MRWKLWLFLCGLLMIYSFMTMSLMTYINDEVVIMTIMTPSSAPVSSPKKPKQAGKEKTLSRGRQVVIPHSISHSVLAARQDEKQSYRKQSLTTARKIQEEKDDDEEEEAKSTKDEEEEDKSPKEEKEEEAKYTKEEEEKEVKSTREEEEFKKSTLTAKDATSSSSSSTAINQQKQPQLLPLPEEPKVYFLNETQVTQHDSFSASWLQSKSDFFGMNMSHILICEDAAFKGWNNRRHKLRMTLDYMDVSIEKASYCAFENWREKKCNGMICSTDRNWTLSGLCNSHSCLSVLQL